MGTWGTGIYASDEALDTADHFKDMLCYGWQPEDAINKALEEICADEEEYYRTCATLALCDTAWKYGCLSDRLKEMGMGLIDAERRQIRSESGKLSKDQKSRCQTLDKLEARLLSPQRAFHRPRKLPYHDMPWHVNEVYAFKLTDSDDYGAILVFTEWDRKPSPYAPETEQKKGHGFVYLAWRGSLDEPPTFPDNRVSIYGSIATRRDGTQRYDATMSYNPYSVQRKKSVPLFTLLTTVDPAVSAKINANCYGSRFSYGDRAILDPSEQLNWLSSRGQVIEL